MQRQAWCEAARFAVMYWIASSLQDATGRDDAKAEVRYKGCLKVTGIGIMLKDWRR